jgi:transcriptional regulator with XRE-family HTH domain
VSKKQPDGLPTFGECLQRAREQDGISAPAMAEKTGMPYASIYRFEANRRSPMWPSAYNIIVNCGLDLSCFFPEELILRAAVRIRSRQRKARREAS